jgi:hypothetical protein
MTVLRSVFEQLASARPVFHSEVDCQLAYAWHLQKALPDARIRLERRWPRPGPRHYVDIWVEGRGGRAAIELKYKTRAFAGVVEGEEFYLLDHSAEDSARYDYCRDIKRSEWAAAAGGDGSGNIPHESAALLARGSPTRRQRPDVQISRRCDSEWTTRVAARIECGNNKRTRVGNHAFGTL